MTTEYRIQIMIYQFYSKEQEYLVKDKIQRMLLSHQKWGSDGVKQGGLEDLSFGRVS